MGLFSIFKRKNVPNNVNHIFEEKERELSLERRRAKSAMQYEKEKLELDLMRLEHERERIRLQQEIQELQESMLPEEEEKSGSVEDALLMALMTQAFKGNSPNAPTGNVNNSAESSTSHPVGAHYSDEQLYQIWKELPKFTRKIIKNLTDEQIKAEITHRMPSIDSDSINRAISIIRNN